MIKIKTFKYGIIASVVVLLAAMYACKTPQQIQDKSGAQLWGENCQRCHNAPSPTMYNDDQWKGIVTHMQVRANITKAEANKILEFIQASN